MKHRLGKNQEGLKIFNDTNLTLNSDVDQDNNKKKLKKKDPQKSTALVRSVK